jgi:hypothetical protein
MIPDETDRRGRQLLAGDVRVGDVVLLENGDSARISAMAPIREARVYQISLSGPNHVYLTNGIWSHNKLTVPSWPTSGVPQP